MSAPTKKELYEQLDNLVVMTMLSEDARGSSRERLLLTGLLDSSLKILLRGRESGEWKNGTLSVFYAMQSRGMIN